MLTALDIVIFLKSHEDLDRIADMVFGALGSQASEDRNEEIGGRFYRSAGLGFEAVLFENVGEVQDPEFDEYGYALNITSTFTCVDLDAFDLDEPLSEYFARLLAFELNLETATEFLMDTTEEGEVLEIRAYKRNPQYRQDSGPLVQKVGVVETRQVLEPFDEEEEGDDLYGDEEA